MIINTGMRTDIPAFYSKWFIKRIEEGFVYVRNPYNPTQITKYSLDPRVVDVLVFCSKNPKPLLPHLETLQAYKQFWFVTITPYGKDIEPNVPDKKGVLKDCVALSKVIGKQALIWRYDPIFLSKKYTKEYHLRAFETMAQALSGWTTTCVVSFIDLYKKVKRNFPEVQEVSYDDQMFLIQEMVAIGKRYHIRVVTCCENEELAYVGADTSGCMNQAMYKQVLGYSLKMPKQQTLRQGCQCIMGHDIGQYNSCMHFCRYCYANSNRQLVMQSYQNHDVNSPLLIGQVTKDDVIHEAKQKSWKDIQVSLF